MEFKPVSQDQLNLQTKLLINNEWVDSGSGKTFPAMNPSNEQLITNVVEAQKEDVDKAVEAAHHAFHEGEWARWKAADRSRLLNKLADLIEREKFTLTTIECLNSGKSWFEVSFVDIPMMVSTFRYYASLALQIEGRTIDAVGSLASMTDHLTYTIQEPVGVVGQIVPWNAPLMMLSWKMAPALAAGCTIVFKASELSPLSALKFGELIVEAGIPKGVVNLISGAGDPTGLALIEHPLINKISFTGSVVTGTKIAQECARFMKRCTAELGGKSPLIICEDYSDLDKAADIAALGLFANNGQLCSAASRIYVHQSVYDEFVKKVTERAKAKVVGTALDANTQIGSIINERQMNKILNYIEKGKTEGAVLQTGGKRLDRPGYFIEPTVFSQVNDDSTIGKEEIFGPVMSIMKPFTTIDEVVKRANSTQYGLAAGVLCKDISTAHQLARKLRSGTIYLNTYHIVDAAYPWGGYKFSGVGRELGSQGLQAYLESNTVILSI